MLGKTPLKLIKFATGVHATEEKERSLTNCLEKERTLFEAFVAERLVTKVTAQTLQQRLSLVQ